MVLQNNFEIPARFAFQPFSAKWRFEYAETVEWAGEPKLRPLVSAPAGEDERTWLRVRIEVPDPSASANALGLHIPGIGIHPSYTVLMDRASIPPDVLQAHETYRNTPDVSGRQFNVLICQMPELESLLRTLEPGKVIKNAWAMRDEFLNLEADPESGWEWSVWQFLNKWGIWEPDRGFTEDWQAVPIRLMPPSAPRQEQKRKRPDFLLVMPHLLREQQRKYRKALLPGNARSWLRSHPLSLNTADAFPFFRVLTSYCRQAIETTITIDHLAKSQFGICKRCHKVFPKEYRHKKQFCSKRCINAAGVQRWREKHRKPNWTAEMVAKVLSQQRSKRNAKD